MAKGKLIADEIEHSSQGTVDTTYIVKGSAKFYAAYDSGAQAKDASLNAGSLTDNATGDTSIAFVANFSGVDAMCFTGGLCTDYASTNKHTMGMSFTRIGSIPYSTSSVRLTTNFDGQTTTLQDADVAHTACLGDLA